MMNISHAENSSSRFPGIDYDIGVGNVLGDDSLFEEIVVMFYEDHNKDLGNIQRAILQKNNESCKRIVHTLKGVACSIGAMHLFEKVKLLDMAINESKETHYLPLLDKITPEFNRIIKGIETELSDKL